jgi:hypothetical protein
LEKKRKQGIRKLKLNKIEQKEGSKKEDYYEKIIGKLKKEEIKAHKKTELIEKKKKNRIIEKEESNTKIKKEISTMFLEKYTNISNLYYLDDN